MCRNRKHLLSQTQLIFDAFDFTSQQQQQQHHSHTIQVVSIFLEFDFFGKYEMASHLKLDSIDH